jgi:hypothetical protein
MANIYDPNFEVGVLFRGTPGFRTGSADGRQQI